MSQHSRKGKWPQSAKLPSLGERECSKCLTPQQVGIGAEDKNGNFRCFNCLKLALVRRQKRDPVQGGFSK